MNLTRPLRSPGFLRTGRSLPPLYRAVPRPQPVARTAPRFYCDKPKDINIEEKESDTQNQETEAIKETIDPELLREKDEQIRLLEETLQDVQDNLKEAQANQENMRKILLRDLNKAEDVGVDKLAKKLFPVSDILDICLKNRPDFDSPEHKDNLHAKAAFDGLQAAKNQFESCFDKLGITEVNPQLGEIFDPMKHDALFELPAPPGTDLGPGTIGTVLKVGWAHESILLRPATVGVVKK